MRLSDWIDNVEAAMVDHLVERTDITNAQRNSGKAIAREIAKQYVMSVQKHAQDAFDVEDSDGVFFGKNGKWPGWTGNMVDTINLGDDCRDCDIWATHVKAKVGGGNGWKVQRVSDALKAGDYALGLMFKHNFVLLKFDPNNTNPAPAFVLDPWINARPEIWDFETFNRLWPIDSVN